MDDWWGKNYKKPVDSDDPHPSGQIPKEDCLNAANNLIADLTKKNRELQENFEAQKRKADSFEKQLAESEEKLENAGEKRQKSPEAAAMLCATTLVFIGSMILLLCSAGIFINSEEGQKELDELRGRAGSDKAILISDLAKSKSEAEKLSDENNKLTAEIDELKKKISPSVPAEEKKEGEVKYKKLRWYHWIFGVLLIILSIFCSFVVLICPVNNDGFCCLIFLFFAVSSGTGAYDIFKPAPQDETVQVEQLKEKPKSVLVKNQPAFVGNAKVVDRGWELPYIFIEFLDGRRARLFTDVKFANLVRIGDVIAVYENDKIEFEKPPPKEKKRVEY